MSKISKSNLGVSRFGFEPEVFFRLFPSFSCIAESFNKLFDAEFHAIQSYVIGLDRIDLQSIENCQIKRSSDSIWVAIPEPPPPPSQSDFPAFSKPILFLGSTCSCVQLNSTYNDILHVLVQKNFIWKNLEKISPSTWLFCKIECFQTFWGSRNPFSLYEVCTPAEN